MKFPKKWLKDVVVVKFHDNGYNNPLLVLPKDIKHHEKICTAKVIAMGSKFRFKDAIKIGDSVYVDSWLGTRRNFDGYGQLVTFDGEDILGVVV